MSNVLGGGGGREGFKHTMEHLGPAVQVWLKDMAAHQYEYTPENAAILDKSVQQELDLNDLAEVETQRDRLTIKLLKDKREASTMV